MLYANDVVRITAKNSQQKRPDAFNGSKFWQTE